MENNSKKIRHQSTAEKNRKQQRAIDDNFNRNKFVIKQIEIKVLQTLIRCEWNWNRKKNETSYDFNEQAE